MAISTGTDVGDLSIQARLEQLEGAIAEAHGHVAKMEPQSTEGPAPESNGVLPSLTRCQTEMSILNERLSRLAAKVGSL